MTFKRKIPHWGLIVACAFSACMRASAPVTPKPAVLRIAKAQAVPPQPFAVVFAGPEGNVTVESEIQIIGSRPLRALTAVAQATVPTILLKPAIPGKWQWVGTQALVFVPTAHRLRYATHYEVEIPAGFRALDGSSLAQPHRYSFETPPPKLVSVSPGGAGEPLQADSQLSLKFDSPVPKAGLLEKLHLQVDRDGRREAYPFDLLADKSGKADQAFTVVPKKPLPRAAVVRVILDAGLLGLEGSIAMPQGFEQPFETLAPLVVKNIDCDRATLHGHCDARAGLDITFNNPIAIKTLRTGVTVDGAKAVLGRWYQDDEETAYVHLEGPFRAGSEVTVRIGPNVTDTTSQRLGKARVERFRFDDFFPRMHLGITGSVFEAEGPRQIPIGSVNVANYEQLYVPLSAENLARLAGPGSALNLFEKGLKLPGANLARIAQRQPKNQLQMGSFEPPRVGATGRGIALFGIRYDGYVAKDEPAKFADVRILQRTNLGLTGHVGRLGSVLWLTSIDSAKPVPGAKVTLFDAKGTAGFSAESDADGLVKLPANAIAAEVFDEPYKHDRVVFVEKGEDAAFRRISELMPEWRVQVPVDSSGTLERKALLFSERGIYRPGERVDVKGLLRRELPRGLAVEVGQPVTVELLPSDGKALLTKQLKTNEFGSFTAGFGLPVGVAPGDYTLQARLGKELVGSSSFSVAEYRPVESEVTVRPSRTELYRGDELTFTVAAKTLFGVAASEAKARIEVRRRPASFAPRGAEGYVTNRLAFDAEQTERGFEQSQLLISNRTLDPQGKTDTQLKALLPGAKGPEWLDIEAEVTDRSQNPVSASAAVLVHPASFYLGLKRRGDGWVSAPAKVGFDVVALGPDGQRVTGRRVDVELLRRHWATVKKQVDGAIRSETQAVDEKVGACSVVSTEHAVACAFSLSLTGNYLVVARSKDEHSRDVVAADQFYATGAGELDVADRDDGNLTLTTDKAEYRVGDVAKILIKSPFPEAQALMVVERSDVYQVVQRAWSAKEPVYEVPITEAMRPNVYVAVHLLRGRQAPPPAKMDQLDLGAPTYRMGHVELRIDTRDRRLNVELKPSASEVRPGGKLEVSALVLDAAGRPIKSEVTLWAVDEGVLALSAYAAPNPSETFLGSRPLQLLPMESREDLGRRSLSAIRDELGLGKGTPGGGGGDGRSGGLIRRDFRATAFFLPNLRTDESGRVTASVTLPDGLSTYRLFALAVAGAEQFGTATERVTTNKPLMLRPIVPRFFRTGDSAEVTAEISSNSQLEGETQVYLRTTGMEPKEASKRVMLRRGQSTLVPFTVKATADEGVTLEMSATLGKEMDRVRLERRAQSATQFEVVGFDGETKTRVQQAIGDLSSVQPARGYLEVTLSNSAFGGMKAGFEQLTEYPYGCSEQLTSKLLALLPLAELARIAGAVTDNTQKAVSEATLGTLLRRQRYDGGFGMWDEAPESSPWVSAYVVSGLLEAKSLGRNDVAQAVARGLEYLRLKSKELTASADPLAPATLAYYVAVLAQAKAPDYAQMTRLFEKRQGLSAFAQASLVHAFATTAHDARSLDTLVRELETRVHSDGSTAQVVGNQGDGYERLFDSNTRDAAMALRALAVARPEHVLLMPLARGLLAQRRGGHWASTQDTAFALLALQSVQRARRITDTAVEAVLEVGQKTLYTGLLGGKGPATVTKRIGLAELFRGDGTLVLEAKAGLLLYEGRLHYVPKAVSTEPVDAGFSLLQRNYAVGVDGTVAALTPGEGKCKLVMELGQLLLEEFTVVVPRPRDFVVVDAPLPAGFEAVDTTLQTTAEYLRRLEQTVAESGSAMQTGNVSREIHDDRLVFLIDHLPIGIHRFHGLVRATTRGLFQRPTAKVEGMYAPEQFGTLPPCEVSVN